MTEKERITVTEQDAPQKEWFAQAKTQTVETLADFCRHLMDDYQHDYGTVVHAVAACALAAAYAADRHSRGGITGFQGGFVMWDFIAEWQGLQDRPLRLVQFENMLYPQYDDSFDKTITPDTWAWIQAEAKKRLDEGPSPVAGRVWEHWRSIAVDGVVPFGYRVAER